MCQAEPAVRKKGSGGKAGEFVLDTVCWRWSLRYQGGEGCLQGRPERDGRRVRSGQETKMCELQDGPGKEQRGTGREEHSGRRVHGGRVSPCNGEQGLHLSSSIALSHMCSLGGGGPWKVQICRGWGWVGFYPLNVQNATS